MFFYEHCTDFTVLFYFTYPLMSKVLIIYALSSPRKGCHSFHHYTRQVETSYELPLGGAQNELIRAIRERTIDR